MKDKNIYLMSAILQILGVLLLVSQLNMTLSIGLLAIGFIMQFSIILLGKMDNLVATYSLLLSILSISLISINLIYGQIQDAQYYAASLLIFAAILSPVIEKPKKYRKKTNTQNIIQPYEGSIQREQKLAENIQINVNESNKNDNNFFATNEGATYHRRDCLSIAKTKRDDLIVFKSKKEATSQRYRPCKLCRP